MPFSDPLSPAWEPLIEAAWQARERAYAPYSGFRVGAALHWGPGTVTAGCNVENAAYPVTQCAERNAIGAAVSQGLVPDELHAVVVVSEGDSPATPCGACRQVLAEFAERLPILLVSRQERSLCRLEDLLPRAFTGRSLK